MALKPCKECGKKVSTEAEKCPHCGIYDPTFVKQLKACKECGEKIDTESVSCPNCGVPNPVTTKEKITTQKIKSQSFKTSKSNKSGSGESYFSIAFIKKVWRGEWPLVKTYWYLGILFALPLYAYLYYLEVNYDHLSEAGAAIGLIFFLFYLVYLVWVNVAIWRSATVYIFEKKKIQHTTFWGYAAKVLVVLALLRAILELLVNLFK